MIVWLESFLFHGFEPGDFTYGLVHVGSVALMLATIPLGILYYRRKTTDRLDRDLRILAAVTLVFYLLRRTVDLIEGRPFFDAFWPFYLCNVNTVFLSVMLLFRIRRGRDFFLITGMSGAILMFVVPEGVFNDRYLTLQIFDSLLSHYMIFIVPILLLSTKAHVLDVSRSWQSLLGLLLVLFNVEVLQPILTGRTVDYLFLRGPIDLSLWFIPQVFVMLFLAILYVYVIIFVNQLLLGRLRVNHNAPIPENTRP